MAKIEFQEIWQKVFPDCSSISVAKFGCAIALYSKSGTIEVLNSSGKSLFTIQAEKDFKSISLADTLEILAVSETGHTYLYNSAGELLWKKRLFAAIYGVIAASGQYFAFITKEPTVILTDRFCRVKWVYRNLQNMPAAIDISAEGQTVAFHCRDQMGQGVATVPMSGKPYPAFMGLDPVISLSVDMSGKLVAALDKGNGVYVYDCVNSIGRWKGKINSDFAGISIASKTEHTFLFGKTGLMVLLNDKGEHIWEYRLPVPLIYAAITGDGEGIFYLAEGGRVGYMKSIRSRGISRMEFVEIESLPSRIEDRNFYPLWQVDIPQSSIEQKWLIFQRADRLDYIIAWDGINSLICIDETGEEIWNNRLTGIKINSISASAESDSILLTTDQGILGLKMDGSENFRNCGTFLAAHPFNNGAIIVQYTDSKVLFFTNHVHFSHELEIGEKISKILGNESVAVLIGETSLFLCDPYGRLTKQIHIGSQVIFLDVQPSTHEFIVGTESGEILLFNHVGEEKLRLSLSGKVNWAIYYSEDDTIFCSLHESKDLFIFQNNRKRKNKISFPFQLKKGTINDIGCIIVNSLDEFLQMGVNGEIFAKYTFPDRVIDLRYSRNPKSFYILAQNSICRFAVLKSSEITKGPQFMEI